MSNSYLLRKVADEYMLVPIGETQNKKRFIVKLNKTAAFIWEEYDKGCTVDGIVTALTEKYKVSKELATADVEKYLEHLRLNYIIE